MMEFFYYGSEFIYTYVKACTTLRLACTFLPYRKENERHAPAVYAALIPAILSFCHSFYFKPDLFSHAAVLFYTIMAGFLAAFLYPDCKKTAFCSAFSLWAALSLLDLFLMSLCSIFIESFSVNPGILTARNAYRGLYLLIFTAFLSWSCKIIYKHLACSTVLQNLYKKAGKPASTPLPLNLEGWGLLFPLLCI